MWLAILAMVAGAKLAPDAIAEEKVQEHERSEEREDRFQEPTEHDVPAGAERASAAAFARETNRERRRSPRTEHTTIAAYGISTTSARPDGDRTARDAARVRRAVAVAQEIGHGRTLALPPAVRDRSSPRFSSPWVRV